MTTAAPLYSTPAHNLSPSSRAEAGGQAKVSGYSPLPPPSGDVIAGLNYFSPPEDGSAPYNFVEPPPDGKPSRNFGDKDDIKVHITDIRGTESEYNLDKDAFAVISNVASSAEKDFLSDDSIKTNYYPEVEKLLLDNIPESTKVVIFDHTIRRAGPEARRKPVQRVHIDQTASSAKDRVLLHTGEEAEKLLQGRYRIVNVWRPLNGPVYSHPLGFASSASVEDKDLIPIRHIYPDRVGQISGVVYNPAQKWHYLSGMRNDERLLLECFDSEALKGEAIVKGGRVPHTAFTDPRTSEDAPGRESIEVRALVFGP